MSTFWSNLQFFFQTCRDFVLHRAKLFDFKDSNIPQFRSAMDLQDFNKTSNSMKNVYDLYILTNCYKELLSKAGSFSISHKNLSKL